MFSRLGTFVSRHWLMVIVGWVLVVALLRWVSPAWDEVTRDGDLAYLPEGMPSVVGEQLLTDAFPHIHAKSHIAFFVARDDRNLDNDDLSVAYDLARRLKNFHGVATLAKAERLAAEAERLAGQGETGAADETRGRSDAALAKAKGALDEAVRLDEKLAEYWDEKQEQGLPSAHRPVRLAAAYHNSALANRCLGNAEEAANDQTIAEGLDPSLSGRPGKPMPETAAELPILDVWTWRDDVFGKKLSTKQARLVIVQLSNEFMATDNIRVLDYLEAELDTLRQTIPGQQRDKLHVGFSGSAAVGGDMLRAAKDSIKNTELFTIVLVVLILGLVYRSPLLVAMPLVTITASLVVATCLVALLTQVGQLPGFEWWDFKVFTTTRIFIVVILFGAGTDYFLFLASRYKEELERGHSCADAVSGALASVGDALAASALTTILGLGTMFFADFGKFKNSGPAIGLCLAVTLAACVTLAPALLRAFGGAVFWPFGTPRARTPAKDDSNGESAAGSPRFRWLWEKVAGLIVAHPGLILVGSVLLLLPLAGHGIWSGNHVTYDFLRQLPRERPSRQGAELMDRHFDIGESGPLTVVVYKPEGGFDTKDGRQRIQDLTGMLYIDGVQSVRSITDPLGGFPPGKKVGLFSASSWTKRLTSPHPRTQEVYVAMSGPYAGDVTRLDLVTKYDPFSVQAEDVLSRVERKLRAIAELDEIREALERYATDTNGFPTSKQGLQALFTPPTDAAGSTLAGWDGPYMDKDGVPEDPWGTAYQYAYPPERGSGGSPDLWSKGPNKTDDAGDDETKDDVRGWNLSPNSGWHSATFAFTGTTAGIRDLKLVTQSDNRRIQILVVLAVLGVLVAILRRPLVCLYMIATVLFSYYVTIGATEWFFSWAYGPDFQGLDWKVPLFLFVILVAIGQDYNVYLATRVFEEQDRRGPQEGLRFAVIRTGGIITSCGVIMAGTFSSMTSGTWGGWVLVLALCIVVLICEFWLLVIAFGESIAAGLMYMFVPFYEFYYVFTRWRKCGRLFIIAVVCCVLMAFGWMWIPLADRFFATRGGALPGIVQLGFALSLGVMLDTFIVRPVLVPACLALLSGPQRTVDDTPTTPEAKSHTNRPREATVKVTS